MSEPVEAEEVDNQVQRVEFEQKLSQLDQKQKLQAILHGLRGVESTYWQAYNVLHMHLLSTADLRDTLQRKLEQKELNLRRIPRDGILDTVHNPYFRISIDRETADGTSPSPPTTTLGTISGFRLGSLPSSPVEWWEINTAWGCAVMLLERLKREVLVPPSKPFWVPHVGAVVWEPRGSYPRACVQENDQKKHYDLYGPVNKLLCPGYDKALVLFIRCLDELGTKLSQRRGTTTMNAALPPHISPKMPYEIKGERIGGISVRYGLSRDVNWSTALRNVLANLDWCARMSGTFLMKPLA